MGSGEADVANIKVFANDIQTSTLKDFSLTGISTTGLDWGTSTGVSNGTNYYTTWYPYATKEYVYMYQVKCPKCSKMNFLELEKVSPCKKCHSRLRAVLDTEDYKIPVDV